MILNGIGVNTPSQKGRLLCTPLCSLSMGAQDHCVCCPGVQSGSIQSLVFSAEPWESNATPRGMGAQLEHAFVFLITAVINHYDPGDLRQRIRTTLELQPSEF